MILYLIRHLYNNNTVYGIIPKKLVCCILAGTLLTSLVKNTFHVYSEYVFKYLLFIVFEYKCECFLKVFKMLQQILYF